MTGDQFNAFCRALPATTHVVQWGGADVWKVAGKVFAVGGWSRTDGPAFSFKASETNFHFLSDEPGYRPAPYFANRGMKWIQWTGDAQVSDDDLSYYLSESYRLVVSGLTKKKRVELGLA